MHKSELVVEQAVAVGVVLFIAAVVRISIGGYRPRGTTGTAGGSLVLGPRIRNWYIDHLAPFEEGCVRAGIPPATLSYTQLAGSILVGALYAAGMLFTAGWLLLATSSLDIIDGRVARRTGGGSPRGAFLDSIIDRYAESFAYCGLALYFRDSWMLWIVLFALVGSLMVSYARARAEALGAENRIGVLQRPERLVILGFGTIFGALYAHLAAPWLPGPPDLVSGLTVLAIAVLANVTALQRVRYTSRELGGERPDHPAPAAPAPPLAAGTGSTAAELAPAALAATSRRVVGTLALMIGAGIVLDLHAAWMGLSVMVAAAIWVISGLWPTAAAVPSLGHDVNVTSTVERTP